MSALLILLFTLALAAGFGTLVETAHGGRCGLEGPPRSHHN